MVPPRIDLTGQTFGRLTVQHASGRRLCGQVVWVCHCSCGTQDVEVAGANLRTGHTLSCGCHRREVAAGGVEGPSRHVGIDLTADEARRLWDAACLERVPMAELARRALRDAGLI